MDARIDRVENHGAITVDGTTHELDNNAWIIGDDDEVIVVDPGHDASAVLDVVGEREVLAVICTNGHPDHVTAALEVADRDEAPVALHPKDLPAWRETYPDDEPEIEVADGGVFEVSDVRLEVISSPGYTPGSICLYCEELGAVFSGDSLLASGPARYAGEYPNFPGQLTAIGEYLLTMPPSTRVLPGHGQETTVDAAEKKFDAWVTAGPDSEEEILALPDERRRSGDSVTAGDLADLDGDDTDFDADADDEFDEDAFDIEDDEDDDEDSDAESEDALSE